MTDTSYPADIRRVGPGSPMASDNAFALALLNLWHRVSEAGGAVGFTPPVDRAAVGAAVAGVVGDLRSGDALGLAAVRGREMIGFAALRPGHNTQAHTGLITQVMVDPAAHGAGLGRALTTAAIDLAVGLGLQRVRVGVRDGAGLQDFYGRFGFVVVGRLPRWIRVGPDDERDEVLMMLELAESG